MTRQDNAEGFQIRSEGYDERWADNTTSPHLISIGNVAIDPTNRLLETIEVRSSPFRSDQGLIQQSSPRNGN